ncbi:hypothetical protein Bca52824_007755 [Brassica carinata]|uniref:Uncharacterized protein n=1 Tax=Brassica carinata TaxID=52824 RepID=A0A8X8B859_BRACI|nr:hypothetical protein Bca52824_007755 [Brassica carinata]
MEEPTSLIDDAEFSLPPEFLTDDDFLVEKENKADRFSNRLLPYEPSHGFELDSGFGSTVKPIGDEEKLLDGLTRKMVQSSLEDDLSGGFLCSHAFPAGNGTKAWGSTSRCGTGGRWNQNCQTQVSSQTVAWDLHYAGAENGYNNHNGRGLLDLPRKHPLAASKIHNDGSGYYNRQSLLLAIQFQQQQLMKRHRQLVQQSRGLGANDNNKIAGSVDSSPSAWSNQHVFLGDRSVKRGSTGTGVFLPRRLNHATAKAREKPMRTTVLVPARVVQPSVRSSPSLNDRSWSNDGGVSRQMKMEEPVEDLRLPLDWVY